jgi:hypothetical protein
MFSHLICTSEAAGGEQHGEGKGDQGLGQNVSNVGPTCYQIAILFHTLHLE